MPSRFRGRADQSAYCERAATTLRGASCQQRAGRTNSVPLKDPLVVRQLNLSGSPVQARTGGCTSSTESVITITSFMSDNRWLADNAWSDPPVTISGSTFARVHDWLASQPDAS